MRKIQAVVGAVGVAVALLAPVAPAHAQQKFMTIGTAASLACITPQAVLSAVW